ncbi:MAG TPA: hypothetical protein DCX07_04810, partial [Phycisphaerales bacterium]|nr:hypothetical protein [Phycisphaerales bacterium]
AREGKVEVFVTTASPLDESDRAQVVAALREALQAEPIVRARVDENVLGGLVVRVGDRVFDASLATQLRRLKKAIVSRKLKATTRE